MAHWVIGAGICAFAFLAGSAAAADPPDGPTVLLWDARHLAAVKKTGLPHVSKGTWYAWAQQRGGAKVQWTLAGKGFPPTTAKGHADTFAWVSPGTLDADGKPVAIQFTPSSAKPDTAAVAALALARSKDFDPARLGAMTRVFPTAARASGDARPGQCRHLNMRFTMGDYPTKAAWQERAAWLRDHVRVSSGLVPEPPRTPLKAKVFGRIERDGYMIEKAYLESRPGFYVCGNLWRPIGKKGPRPAVACPHGHWTKGRFGHQPPRGSVPARCITLAKLGYVVFNYDMVGYNDSGKQIPQHRGIFPSKANALWGLSMMHLQSWNTLRVLDWLQTLPDVDPKRLALTGCSGGGTQTFMVMGIEPRLAAAAPVCMISGIMQGGCECENAPLLRIETNNIEIGALMAPRPMIMPSATGDWTKETPKVEYPSIRGIYELFGAADRVGSVQVDSPHGYNLTHREWVYNFFRRWVEGVKEAPTTPPRTKATTRPVKLTTRSATRRARPFPPGPDEWIAEPPYKLEKREDLLVWQGRALPKDARTPKTLAADVIAQGRHQRDQLLPAKPEDCQRFQQTLGVAYRHAVLAELPPAGQIVAKDLGSQTLGQVRITRLLIGRDGKGDQVPALLFRPSSAPKKTPAAVVVHPAGKAGLIDPASAAPGPPLAALLAAGRSVLAIDPYLLGEYQSPFAETKQKTRGFFDTYNRTEVVQRVQDILTALAYLKSRPDTTRADLVGLESAGAWCLLAAPFTGKDTRIAADLAGLTGDEDPRWTGDLYSPLLLKAGAPWTPAALAAPRRLLLHDLAQDLNPRPFRAAYQAAGATEALRIERRRCGPKAVVTWLAGQ